MQQLLGAVCDSPGPKGLQRVLLINNAGKTPGDVSASNTVASRSVFLSSPSLLGTLKVTPRSQQRRLEVPGSASCGKSLMLSGRLIVPPSRPLAPLPVSAPFVPEHLRYFSDPLVRRPLAETWSDMSPPAVVIPPLIQMAPRFPQTSPRASAHTSQFEASEAGFPRCQSQG